MAGESHFEELRCFCRSKTLLAVVGVTDGQAWLHIKSHKSGRVLSEIYLDAGKARIMCRSCGRWHSVTVSGRSVERNDGATRLT